MSGKTRPSQRAKVLSNVDYSNLSHTDKKFIHNMFALVEEKQAEIEWLKEVNAFHLKTITENAQRALEVTLEETDKARTEAIKEFAEKLVDVFYSHDKGDTYVREVVYNLVKEMVDEECSI